MNEKTSFLERGLFSLVYVRMISFFEGIIDTYE